MPVIDMKWIIGQYYQLYSKKIAQPTNQSKMDTQIQCGISGISCCVERESFLVVEDSCCNLYEVGRQYATRGMGKDLCSYSISELPVAGFYEASG